MRGLWVDSDDKLSAPQGAGGHVLHRFGSLPDFELEYQVLFNSNYIPRESSAFKVLNPLVELIPPLDRTRSEAGLPGHCFLAKSQDEQSVKIRDTLGGGLPGREMPVAYRQSTHDGSIRVVVPLVIGSQAAGGAADTSKAVAIRMLVERAAEANELSELFHFFVRRGGVQSELIESNEVSQ
jgi:hypothetical protein